MIKTIHSCLERANQHNLQSIAIPAISSGIFGYPKDLCAQHIFEALEAYAQTPDPDQTVRRVQITVLDDETVAHFFLKFIELYCPRDRNYEND